MTASLEVEDDGPVRWLWLNRPEVHNAQNVDMLTALDEEFQRVSTTSSARVLVIAGRGPSFSSGHDLSMMGTDEAYLRSSSSAEGRYIQESWLYADPVRRLVSLPIPTIARVHGHCIGAGLMLAAATDFLVCSSEATFQTSILQDLAVNGAEVPTLAWAVGERRAKELMWLGEPLSAERAERIGLASWVTSRDELDDRVGKLATKLLDNPPHALALSKASLDFLASRKGRDDYFTFHFTNHQLTHHTTEATARLNERLQRIRRGGSR